MKSRAVAVCLLLAIGTVACLAQSVRGPRRVVERDGKLWLFGGEDPSQDFDVTQFRLDPDRLNYGLGREKFPALIEPEFESARDADRWLSDADPVLGVSIGGEVKAYPISLLTRHEVVNDVVGGRPIFAAYCILADLGAIYDRHLGEHTYTLALSGYTYSAPDVWDGLQAFVLWDRDTESLWLPTIGKAVSGPMIDVPMLLLLQDQWEQTTWGEFREKHPDARVLKPGQDMRRPESWERYTGPFPERTKFDPKESIAPR